MNFDCANINSLFMNIIQVESSGNSFLNQNQTPFKNSIFADRLNEVINANDKEIPASLQGRPFKNAFLNKLFVSDDSRQASISDSSVVIDKLTAYLDDKKGTSFLVSLKNFLMSVSSQDLKSLTINSKGLSALKELLLNAGFDKKMVNELMVDLHEALQETELTLFECFDKLTGLMEKDGVQDSTMDQESEPEAENLLALSVIPFIQTLLTVVKLSPEKIESVLSDATRPQEGVDLDILIDKLQQIQKTAFLSHQQLKTGHSGGEFQMLLKQLGLENSRIAPSELTLHELVQAFEGLREEIKQPADATVKPAGATGKMVANRFTKASMSTNPGAMAPVDSVKVHDILPEVSTSPISQKQQMLTSLLQNIEIKEPKGIKIKGKAGNDFLATRSKAEMLMNHIESKIKQDNAETPLFGKAENQSLYKSLFQKIQAISKGLETEINGKPGVIKDPESALARMGNVRRPQTDITPMTGTDIKTSETLMNLKEAAAKPAARNLPNYVAHQVKQSLVRAINQGTNELKIQLKPPELGRLMMTIENMGNNMKVTIMTENQAAKDILVSSINEMKAMFTNSGINLENVEVGLGSDFRQSMADAKNQAEQFGKQNQGRKSRSNRMDDDSDQRIEAINMDNSSMLNSGWHFVA